MIFDILVIAAKKLTEVEKKQIHDHKVGPEVASRQPLARSVSASSSRVSINKENDDIRKMSTTTTN